MAVSRRPGSPSHYIWQYFMVSNPSDPKKLVRKLQSANWAAKPLVAAGLRGQQPALSVMDGADNRAAWPIITRDFPWIILSGCVWHMSLTFGLEMWAKMTFFEDIWEQGRMVVIRIRGRLCGVAPALCPACPGPVRLTPCHPLIPEITESPRRSF